MEKHHPHPRSHRHQREDFFRSINIQLLVHDLKGPLDVIETNIRMLLEFQHDHGRLTASQQKALERAMRNAAKLRSIIHGLLEVGSSQTGRFDLQRFNAVQCTLEVLVDVVETSVGKGGARPPEKHDDPTGYLAANGIHFRLAPEIHGIQLYQDKTKFCHILANLIRNGLCFKSSRVTVEMAVKGEVLEIGVSDDGPGIGPGDRKLLFRRYTHKQPHGHLRRKGHGLGLASSRILARYLGGDISVGDRHQVGIEFVLRLPLTFQDKAGQKQLA